MSGVQTHLVENSAWVVYDPWRREVQRGQVLNVKDLRVAYLQKEILQGISIHVGRIEVAALVGANGSGKLTLLKAIAGLIKPTSGLVFFNDLDITGCEPHEINRLGIAYLMQGGEIFPSLTVRENLTMALSRFGKKEHRRALAIAYDAFPKLEKVSTRRAGLLSGGEREMLAISMVIVQKPSLMLLDEPSAGLAPLLVAEFLPKIRSFAKSLGASVLLVEQNVRVALSVSDRVYRLRDGTAREVAKERALDDLLVERGKLGDEHCSPRGITAG